MNVGKEADVHQIDTIGEFRDALNKSVDNPSWPVNALADNHHTESHHCCVERAVPPGNFKRIDIISVPVIVVEDGCSYPISNEEERGSNDDTLQS